jgi:hypothetical protein
MFPGSFQLQLRKAQFLDSPDLPRALPDHRGLVARELVQPADRRCRGGAKLHPDSWAIVHIPHAMQPRYIRRSTPREFLHLWDDGSEPPRKPPSPMAGCLRPG